MSSPAANPKVVYPLGVLLTLGSVVVLALWGCLDFYSSSTLMSRAGRDPHRIGFLEERLREAAVLLPRNAVVGYLSDMSADEAQGSAVFLGSQYVLAPRLLVEVSATNQPDWVLGNFYRPADYEALAKDHQLVLVKDFGAGVAVFRRRSR